LLDNNVYAKINFSFRKNDDHCEKSFLLFLRGNTLDQFYIHLAKESIGKNLITKVKRHRLTLEEGVIENILFSMYLT
jgi:hypothetical protein